MARGIGGDDGPTLWMFVAVILIWTTVRKWFGEVSDKASEVVNRNYANPIQKETTQEIAEMEKAVKNTFVPWSKLGPKTYFQRIAMSQRQNLDTGFNVDEDKLFKELEPLSADQLRAVYHCFGVKDRTNGLITLYTGDLFDWYEKELDSWGMKPTEMERMRAIWAKARIW